MGCPMAPVFKQQETALVGAKTEVSPSPQNTVKVPLTAPYVDLPFFLI